MDEQKLLALAAKAYGIDTDRCFQYVDGAFDWPGKAGRWNPLTDDGDSRRLQVALSIDLRFGVSGNFGPYVQARNEVRRGDVIDFHECYMLVSFHPDANAAVRRAVLEVAAAIGQSMP